MAKKSKESREKQYYSNRDPLVEKLLSDEPLNSEPKIIPRDAEEITKEFPVVETVIVERKEEVVVISPIIEEKSVPPTG